MKNTVRGSAGVAGSLMLTAAVLSGTAVAADGPPRCGDGPCEAVTLHNGETKYLPYKAMPRINWGDGLPDFKGIDFKVSDHQALAALGVSDTAQDIYDIARKTNPALKRMPEQAFFGTVESNNAFFFKQWVLGGPNNFINYPGYAEATAACESGRAVCGFVGGTTDKERAPVISQSDHIQGPTKFTSHFSVTSSVSHSKTEGWNIGGEVKGSYTAGPKGGPGGEASFTWGYNNSSTDTSSYATTSGMDLEREVKAGEWGYEEVRASAAKYTGYMYIVQKYEGKAAIGIVPLRQTLKAEGAVPPVNRMWVTTKLGGKESAEAKKLSTQMAKKYQQRNSLPAPQRKDTEEWLTQAESRMRDLLDKPQETHTPPGAAK
ncbi:hypothetical protein ACIGW8_38465 [Streptomyces sioyaensis]|uniref:hypothetical protein n=1 Tax=Streptomyces sioyaensis TaxID=67364 RepID=UPI0037CED51B